MVRLVDRATDPQIRADLALARLGQAYFSRKLNELDDVELSAPSLLPGWTRAHVIAHVGYNARAIARLVEWAETGIENPMYDSAASRQHEIDFGATLSARALRHLSDHAAVQLDVAWRDLPDDRWSHEVKSALGRSIPVSESVWLRTRELWLHALDLDNGARARDIPHLVLLRILEDVLTTWRTRDGLPVRVRVDDALDDSQLLGGGDEDATSGAITVEGSVPDLVLWATGRGRRGVVEVDREGRRTAEAPEARRWI